MNHIGWPDLPKLVARLKLVDVQLKNVRFETRMRDCNASSYITKLYSSMVEVTEPSKTASLGTYLNTVWSTIEIVGQGRFGDLVVPTFCSDLKESLQASDCQACGAQHKCHGDESSKFRNNDNLRDHGYCLSLLSQVFQIADKLSLDLYKRYASCQTGPLLNFETTKLTADEVNRVGRGIDAKIYEHEELGRRTIRVAIDPIRFDISDYYSAFYIFFHECFVHGYCGVSLNGDSADLSDRFHEGWMDEVGAFLLETALSNPISTLIVNAGLDNYAHEFIIYTRKLHEKRLDFRCDKPASMAATYADGAQAARRFRLICAIWSSCETIGDEMFYQFSLKLNSSPASDQERVNLVSKVNDMYEIHGIAETVLMLSHSLEIFSKDRDAQILMHSIESIY